MPVTPGGARRAVEASNGHLRASGSQRSLQHRRWIAERAGADVALSYVSRLERYCSGFEFAGVRGRRRDDLRPGLRVIAFERRVAIVFAVSDDEVTILRLYYGGQSWERQGPS